MRQLLKIPTIACRALAPAIALVIVVPALKLVATPVSQVRPFIAKEAFDYRQPIIFQDNFNFAQFVKWQFSVNFTNFSFDQPQAHPAQIQIVDAPGLGAGRHAVQFSVRRGPDSFRSELCLPPEDGFQERWYGEKILVPRDWVFDSSPAATLVMQWHAVRGNWKPTFPNLAISIVNTNWIIRQSFGSAQKPARTQKILSEPVVRGIWVSWVIRAKWSPTTDGLIQIWKDGNLVLESHGTNVYSTIGVESTPYFKTGIYHPYWRMDQKSSEQQDAFFKEINPVTNKVVYVTDVKIGSERARFADVAPDNLAPKP